VTDTGVGVALDVAAAPADVENPWMGEAPEKNSPAQWGTPDSTVTEAHSNGLFARFESPGATAEAGPVEGVGSRTLAPDASRLSVLAVVE
jgi:hypothetical protein